MSRRTTTNPFRVIRTPSVSNLHCTFADRCVATIHGFTLEIMDPLPFEQQLHVCRIRKELKGFTVDLRQRHRFAPDLLHQLVKDTCEAARREGRRSKALVSEFENRHPPVTLFEA